MKAESELKMNAEREPKTKAESETKVSRRRKPKMT